MLGQQAHTTQIPASTPNLSRILSISGNSLFNPPLGVDLDPVPGSTPHMGVRSIANLLMCVFLGCGRKPEILEETYTDTVGS